MEEAKQPLETSDELTNVFAHAVGFLSCRLPASV
jgi:hypothetical protein